MEIAKKYKVYRDTTEDGVHYTIYKHNKCLGEYLGDDGFLKSIINLGCSVIDCDWRDN